MLASIRPNHGLVKQSANTNLNPLWACCSPHVLTTGHYVSHARHAAYFVCRFAVNIPLKCQIVSNLSSNWFHPSISTLLHLVCLFHLTRLSTFLPSVRLLCPSTCISAAATRRISAKFGIGDVYENLSRNSRLG
jgi:hypothetical protein